MGSLNPIEQKIASGMSHLIAFLSEATCGEACWQAREDICRCSCGGKNHGCMRTADGSRPVRTSRIDGYMYELKAVGVEGLHFEAMEICKAYRFGLVQDSDCVYEAAPTWPKAPARLKTATDIQISRWPELTAYREGPSWTEETGTKHYLDKPSLLWVRTDIAA